MFQHNYFNCDASCGALPSVVLFLMTYYSLCEMPLHHIPSSNSLISTQPLSLFAVALENVRRIDQVNRVCSVDPYTSNYTIYKNFFGPLTVRAIRADSTDEGFQILLQEPNLMKNLIVDDMHKSLFCYVPKVCYQENY